VDASKCKDLIDTDGHKLPLSAANSMNYLASCLEDDGSWVADNYVLYNILDPICTWGYDEKCSLDWESGANQATCPHELGSPVELTSEPVYNIQYPSGKKVLASTGQEVSGSASGSSGSRNGSVLFLRARLGVVLVTMSHAFIWSLGLWL